jgi:hypothetical protein
MKDERKRENLWVTPKGKSVHARVRLIGGELEHAVCGVASDNWKPLDQAAALAHLDAKEGWKVPNACAKCFDVRPTRVTLTYSTYHPFG